MLDACISERVDIVVPTTDRDLLPIASASSLFVDASAWAVISDRSAVALARDKGRTAAALEKLGAPRTWAADVARDQADELPYPVIVKPVTGSSSEGVRIARRPADLPSPDSAEVVQELLEGQEYTVNCYTDASGRVVAVVAHERVRVRSGEVSHGIVRTIPEVDDHARSVAAAVPGLRGPWCYQFFRSSSGEIRPFEINARFGGGYPLADAAGAPFAEWILRERLGLPLPEKVDITDGMTMVRFDQSVFLEP